MPRYLCPQCGFVEKTLVKDTEETYPVLGEPITVPISVRTCAACGEWIGDDTLDHESMERAFRIYRSRHDVISPSELIAMRERVGLSQREFADLLGWSESTLNRYEKGAIPDTGHNRMLRLLQVTDVMEVFLHRNLLHLPEGRRNAVLSRLGKGEVPAGSSPPMPTSTVPTH